VVGLEKRIHVSNVEIDNERKTKQSEQSIARTNYVEAGLVLKVIVRIF